MFYSIYFLSIENAGQNIGFFFMCRILHRKQEKKTKSNENTTLKCQHAILLHAAVKKTTNVTSLD